MRGNRGVVAALSLGLGLCLFGACQVYDFEPVKPMALLVMTDGGEVSIKKANLMFLVDRSGSMTTPIDATLPTCPNCPTRGSELKDALKGFLAGNGSLARMGLGFYSHFGIDGGDECSPLSLATIRVPINTSSDDGAQLQATANQINNEVQSATFSGGTPTAESLRALGGYSALLDPDPFRTNVVVLVTDGLPNCNANHSLSSCICTGTGTQCSPPPAKLCLDDANSVSAVTELKAKRIGTIVVGFGADTAGGEAFKTLNAMAQAGGYPRSCGADAGVADCKKYYQAANGAELAQILREIISKLIPCNFPLYDVHPQNEGMIQLKIEDQVVNPAEWDYDSATNEVRLTDSYCSRLKSTVSNSFKVELKVLQSL